MRSGRILGNAIKHAILIIILAAHGLAARQSETGVEWIGEIRGLSKLSDETSSYSTKTVYTVSGSLEQTFDRVRAGLTERGWTVQKTTSASAGIAAAREIVAEKGGSRVRVGFAEALGIKTIDVVLRPPAGSERTRAPKPSTRETTELPLPLPGVGIGAGVVLSRDGITDTYDCGGGDVIVNGDSCDITVEGNCLNVIVNGDSNTLRVNARILEIVANGSDNVVTWSPAANRSAPSIVNHGTNNRIRRAEK